MSDSGPCEGVAEPLSPPPRAAKLISSDEPAKSGLALGMTLMVFRAALGG
jgi:hypothetical protein